MADAADPTKPSNPQPGPAAASSAQPPRIVRKRKGNFWLVWLIPLVASLIGLSIVWHDWSNRGPTISIRLDSASGLEAGKTQIKFRDVVVGTVTNIRLSDTGDEVLVDAELNVDARGLAKEGTQFWVVKPTIGLSGVSGLSTLLSGVYINADTKTFKSDAPEKLHFVALTEPPAIASDRPGSRFNLRSDTLGSLGRGAPIYFLRIPVGVVTKYELDENGTFVDIEVFVDAPYDKYVGGNTRFWNESGIYVNVGSEGLTVSTESLVSILAGGLAFGNFGPPIPLETNQTFKLYANKALADEVPIGLAVPVTMKFYQSTKGLEAQAPVTFQGVEIGVVNSADLDFDIYKGEFFTHVKATLYPARLGSVAHTMQEANKTVEQATESLAMMIRRGLRAELKTASLLTGSLYVSMSLMRDAPPVKEVMATVPIGIPTVVTSDLEDIQKQIASIVESINKIPFDQLSADLSKSLTELTELGKSLNNTLTPELSATLKDLQSTLGQVDNLLEASGTLPTQLDNSLKEIDKAVRATKSLIDELRAQPNSIIFGEPSPSYSRETLGSTP
ncbi:MAG: MlaD family protein [Burkholderiaceae bacterium]|nr:MlaD family protein [Burkholderiaceae bacterium]